MKKVFVMLITMLHISQLASQLTWNSPVNLSTSEVNASDPHVVMDVNGNITAVWVENETIMANTQPYNGSWGIEQAISGSSSSSPRLGVDGSGNVTAIWLQSGVVYTSTLPFSGSWSTATALPGSGASAPSIAVDSAGDIAIIWASGGYIYATMKPTAGSFSSASQISGADSNNPNVSIGVNGNVMAVWHSNSSGIDLVYSSTALISGSWGTAQTITPAGLASLSHNYPKCAVDGDGNGYALWYRYDFDGTDYLNVTVLTSIFYAASNTWSPLPTGLVDAGLMNPANLSNKILADSNGNVFAIWTNSYDNSTFNIESANLPTGGEWSLVEEFLSENLYAFQIDASLDLVENIVNISMFYDGSTSSIQASQSDLTGPFANIWSTPSTISTGIDNGYPKVASAYISGEGQVNAVSVWLASESGIATVQAATASLSILNPPTDVSAVQTSTSFGLFTDYTNTVTWTDSTSPNLWGYAIYRNGINIGDSGYGEPNEYVEHNQVEANGSITYSIIAIDNYGTESETVTTTL